MAGKWLHLIIFCTQIVVVAAAAAAADDSIICYAKRHVAA
jgi:hypothetical protein